MATISKFYFHDAATTNTGTMPTGAFINIGANVGDADGDAVGARTPRAADDVIGPLQQSSVITAVANTTRQLWGHRRFVSEPLGAQTFAAADGNWTFSFAAAESNTLHNGNIYCSAYVWRPSTGARVGTISAQPNVGLTATAETAYSTATTAWSGTQAILDGDILVFELVDNFVQGMNTAYTSTFFYDGTTEASTTSCASFISPPAPLTLSQNPPVATHPPPHLPFV